MKPIIIFKEKNKNGKYEFTEKEFKDFLEKAYEEGYEEGKRASTPICPSLNPAPYTTPAYPSPNGTGDKFWWNNQPTTGKLTPNTDTGLTSVTSKPDPNVILRG